MRYASSVDLLLRLFLALFLIISFNDTLFAQIANGLDAVTLGVLHRHPKLHGAPSILQALEAGKSETRVIVNLKKPDRIHSLSNLKDSRVRQERSALVRTQLDQVLTNLDNRIVKINNRFKYITGFSATVSTHGLQHILENPSVISVEPDMVLLPHLNQGVSLINADTVRSTYSGAGMAIAICDTGIDYTHPNLGNDEIPGNSKVIGGYDTGQDDNDPMDGNGHGTACAGIAAGDIGSTGDYIGGVAPDAKLYALKITYTSTGGSAWSSDMVEAWEWCVTHQNDDLNHPIRIISTSFGGGRYDDQSSCDMASITMATAAANAKAAGITIFASSGNDGYCDSLGWPGCLSDVVGVGAVYDADFGNYTPCVSVNSCVVKNFTPGCSTGYYAIDDTQPDMVTSYSNTASFLSLLAPANRAYTTDISGSGGYSSGNYYTSFGGTSAACPYTAGAAAVLQSAAYDITGTYLTPDQVKSTLTSTGDQIADGKAAITKPRVNLNAAVNTLCITSTYYQDNDGDNFGNPNASIQACAQYTGYVSDNTDCNDADGSIYPGATEVADDGIDQDCNGSDTITCIVDDDQDGYGTHLGTITLAVDGSCDTADSESTITTDCEDGDDTIHPGATEICNEKDDDCDGQIDEGCVTYFRDADSDTYGDFSDSITATSQPAGYVPDSSDCDDGDASINPAAAEACNGVDDNCDSTVPADENDSDSDGWRICDGDCDDSRPGRNPGAPEICDGRDNDCDGSLGNGAGEADENDYDGDSYFGCGPYELGGNPSFGGGDCDDFEFYANPGHEEVCDGFDNDCDDTIDEDLDADGDGWTNCAGDCDDDDAGVSPGATEICDGKDSNCDGIIPNEEQDPDSDGYLECAIAATATPPTWVLGGGDCNDEVEVVNPGAAEVCDGWDNNCDGNGEDDGDGDTFLTCTGFTDNGATNSAGLSLTGGGDCDDGDDTIHPGATEICTEKDDDCDGQIDEGCVTYYRDADGDSYGGAGDSATVTSQPTGYVTDSSDCNDTNPGINPGATEVCNGVDDDCEGQTDEGLATSTWYRDFDDDTYGDPADSVEDCALPSGYVADNTDCDDDDTDEHPGQTWYKDTDGDDYSDGSTDTSSCERPAGYKTAAELTTTSGDCDDTDVGVNPSITEICNEKDDDCDELIDEGVKTTYYQDEDGDGYGDSSITRESCQTPDGYVVDSTDCDDTKADVHPGTIEICNEIDDDCDAQIDEECVESSGLLFPIKMPDGKVIIIYLE